MRSGGSSQKGSAFERKVCRQLSHWLSNGKRDDLFWRSAMSGGRATLGLKKGIVRVTQAGDVTAIDGRGLGAQFLKRFVVECKHVKNLELANLVAKQTGAFVKHWLKHEREAQAHQRAPFLVARQNRFPTLLFLQKKSVLDLSRGYLVLATFRLDDGNVCALNFDAMLKEPPPNV